MPTTKLQLLQPSFWSDSTSFQVVQVNEDQGPLAAASAQSTDEKRTERDWLVKQPEDIVHILGVLGRNLQVRTAVGFKIKKELQSVARQYGKDG